MLSVEVERDDLGRHHIRGVPVGPSFEINGALTFQPLAGGRALFNGDFPLKPTEVNRFIDALLANHLVFQAEHQHFYDLTPPVWFIHFRASATQSRSRRRCTRDAADLRETAAAAARRSRTRRSTSARLKRILGSSSAEVGTDGVVTLTLTRKNTEHLGGVLLNQNANAETNIAFEPLNQPARGPRSRPTSA